MSTALLEFRARAKAVRAFLTSLRTLEVEGYYSDQSYRKAAALAASRASAFIMMYNCIEYALRASTIDLREDIVGRAKEFSALREYWQFEIVKAHFHGRLSEGGSQHLELLKDFVTFLPGRVDWKGDAAALPFAGNVDQDRLFRLVKAMGYRWRPPKASLGGSDLEIVRKARNDLAHGQESFETVGRQFTTSDLDAKFARIKKFVESFIAMVERYKTRQLYLRG